MLISSQQPAAASRPSMADRYRARFGAEPEWIAYAPGRVNLIGEHVDYCDGWVLPLAIDRGITICAGLSGQARITAHSKGFPEAVIELNGSICRGEPAWSNYLRGVLAGFRQREFPVPGLNLLIESTLPAGAGLSSSAALIIALASLLEIATGASFAPKEKALLGQAAEHQFALVPCGIMDHFAAVFGQADHALLIDCRSMEVTPAPLSTAPIEILIFNTGVKHSLASGEYAARRRECEQAAKHLGVRSLRDLSGLDWRMRLATLSPALRPRARHVLTEMERALETARLWRSGTPTEAGRLLYASHASLRDDYEVSCPALDYVVEVARELPGVHGCRMTGGGFGGCCVAVVESARSQEIQWELDVAYRRRYGIAGSSFLTKAADGAWARKFA